MTAGIDSFSTPISVAGTFSPAMGQTAEERFLEALEEIERAARFVARRAGLDAADADDLSATVKLRLIEDDYAILRRFGGRCSLATYVASIAHRICADEWAHVHGRWRPSAEARRLGQTAVVLEGLLRRDGRTLDEAVVLAQRVDPGLTRTAAVELTARLPERAARATLVPIESGHDRPAGGASADERVVDAENAAASDAASRAVRETLTRMTAEDRIVLRMRFDEGLRVADIARMLACDQKQLYRRIDALIRTLREALLRAGIDAVTAHALIGADASRLHFGLAGGEKESTP
jgi:RNA polymerase sigma factor (sigma-70 family)